MHPARHTVDGVFDTGDNLHGGLSDCHGYSLATWGLDFSMTSSPSPSCPVSPWPTLSTTPQPLNI